VRCTDRKKERTFNLGNTKADADGGVGEGHDGGDGGEPPYLVQVRDLREDDLHHAEDGDVWAGGGVAGVTVASVVKAPRPPDGSAHGCMQQRTC